MDSNQAAGAHKDSAVEAVAAGTNCYHKATNFAQTLIVVTGGIVIGGIKAKAIKDKAIKAIAIKLLANRNPDCHPCICPSHPISDHYYFLWSFAYGPYVRKSRLLVQSPLKYILSQV